MTVNARAPRSKPAPSRAPAGKPSRWLIGTWKSDKAATVAAWGTHPPGSPEFQRSLHDRLGTLVNKYTAKRSTSTTPEWESTVPYRVLWENADALFLVYGKKDEEHGLLVTFASPQQYWVHVGRYIEFFRKQ